MRRGNATTPKDANSEVTSADGGDVVKPRDRESTRSASGQCVSRVGHDPQMWKYTIRMNMPSCEEAEDNIMKRTGKKSGERRPKMEAVLK